MADWREVARTARTYVVSRGLEPAAAWDEATKRAGIRTRGGYPKTTFLGLCEAGYVRGIPAGTYADRAGAMRQYAARMVELLVEDDDYEDDPMELFTTATDGKVGEQGQLDVLFGLWNHGLIDVSSIETRVS